MHPPVWMKTQQEEGLGRTIVIIKCSLTFLEHVGVVSLKGIKNVGMAG